MKGAVQESDGHGQHARQERIQHRVAGLGTGPAAGQQHAQLEQARQVQADQREQRGQQGHHGRGLQLETPAQLLPAARRPSSRPPRARKLSTTPAP
jgi:hypothetical protein